MSIRHWSGIKGHWTNSEISGRGFIGRASGRLPRVSPDGVTSGVNTQLRHRRSHLPHSGLFSSHLTCLALQVRQPGGFTIKTLKSYWPTKRTRTFPPHSPFRDRPRLLTRLLFPARQFDNTLGSMGSIKRFRKTGYILGQAMRVGSNTLHVTSRVAAVGLLLAYEIEPPTPHHGIRLPGVLFATMAKLNFGRQHALMSLRLISLSSFLVNGDQSCRTREKFSPVSSIGRAGRLKPRCRKVERKLATIVRSSWGWVLEKCQVPRSDPQCME